VSVLVSARGYPSLIVLNLYLLLDITYSYPFITTQSMDLLQNSLPGSSYVDARYATVNSAAGDQLIINTAVNREFIILLPVYLVSNPSL
jgi:hypothetical protein